MCGPLLWGYWWIFPLVGFVMCIAFMLIMAFRFGRAGGGCMGMCGGHRTRGDRPAEPHS